MSTPKPQPNQPPKQESNPFPRTQNKDIKSDPEKTSFPILETLYPDPQERKEAEAELKALVDTCLQIAIAQHKRGIRVPKTLLTKKADRATVKTAPPGA